MGDTNHSIANVEDSDVSHPAARAGTNLVRRNADRGLPHISFDDAKRCQLVRATADGNCAYHAFSLFFNERNATEDEVQQCKKRLEEHVLQWVVGTSPDGHAFVDDRELDQQQKAKLMKLGLFESFVGGCISWARDTSKQERSAKSKTIGWARSNVKDRIASEWLAIPWLAIAAKTFQCNIAVWEAAEGGKLRVYENGCEVGLFLENREARFMHMVYNSNAGGGDLSELPIWSTRRPAGGGLSGKHNHFDILSVGEDVDPWCAWREDIAVVGGGRESVACVSSSSTAAGSCPMNIISTPATTELGGVLGSVEKSAGFTGGVGMADMKTVVSNRVGGAGCVDDSSSTGGFDSSRPEPQRKPNGKCVAKMASGHKNGNTCEKPTKSPCGMLCGLHSREVAPRKKRGNSGVGVASGGAKRCRGIDPPPRSKGTTGGCCDSGMTDAGGARNHGSGGVPEVNPADLEKAGSNLTNSRDWKQFMAKVSKIPETWSKAAYRQVCSKGTDILLEKVRGG